MIKVNLFALIHAKPGARETIVLDTDSVLISDLDISYLKGTLHFTRVDYGILITGTLDAKLKVECIRCLKPFYESVVIELEDTINLPGADLTPERPVRVAEDGWVDLSPLVRESAWIAVPVKPICSPDCQGICPDCGGNINLGECTCEKTAPVDPRWGVLQTLLEKT
ncbi:MAG: YceD family protein [Anaerolineae bacterium]